MLDARSPLAGHPTLNLNGMTLAEAPGFNLTQVAGEDKALKKALGKLPASVGTALEHDGRVLMRIAPKQLWVIGEAPHAADGVYVTPLSSGRTRLLLDGPRAREVLAACALIDFHESQFKPGQFLVTGIHHTPVLIHCVGDNSFHIYAMRTFALNVREWVADMIEGLRHD